MRTPQSVTHSKFPVDRLLYDDGEFAVAWGSYEGGPRRLGMRWSGDPNNPDDTGYPKLFKHPVWFMLPEALNVAFARALVGTPSADQQAVLHVLEQLRADGALG